MVLLEKEHCSEWIRTGKLARVDLQGEAEQKVWEGEEQNTGIISVEVINTEFMERLGESMGGLAM